MIEGAERPPAGAPVVVRVEDTTYADAAAEVVAEARGRVSDGGEALLESLELPFASAGPGDYRVRAHVDVDDDGAVTRGDYVSTASYAAGADMSVRVVVRKV